MVRNSHWYVEPLKRENYDTWKVEAQAVLVELGLWRYVNGSLPPPLGLKAKAEYENKDVQAMSVLVLMISPSILERVDNFISSKALWDSLDEIYQNMDPNFNMDPPPKTKLIKQLLSMKLNEGEDVRVHLNAAFKTVDTLAEMGIAVDSDFLSVMLLNSLPPSYESFRQATESLDNLPPPEDLKIEIITESYTVTPLPDFECNGCGESGHDANDCASNRASTSDVKLEKIICLNNYTEGNNEVWQLDSGSSVHMSGDRDNFQNMIAYKGSYAIQMGSDNFKAQVKGIGNVTLNLPECDTELFDAVYVPSLSMNLISVSKITDKGYHVLFEIDCATVRTPEGRVLLRAERSKGLYVLKTRPNLAMENEIRQAPEFNVNEQTSDRESIMRPIALNTRPNLAMENEIRQAPELNVNEQTRDRETIMRPIQTSNTLDIVHCGVSAPMQVQSAAGSTFFVTFVDEYTRLSCVYALNRRSQVVEIFVDYKTTVENSIGRKIKFMTIYDESGGYGTWRLNRCLRRAGIQWIRLHAGAHHTPCNKADQNNIAGPHNWMLLTKAQSLIRNNKCDAKSWDEAIFRANYWYNRTPLEVLNNEMPLQRWTAHAACGEQ